MTTEKVEMVGVREYAEEMPVVLSFLGERPVIVAHNEAGCNCTEVDLIDVLSWVEKNMPDLLWRALNGIS